MPRIGRVLCTACDSRMLSGLHHCPNCKAPTIWATREERTEWELKQWQDVKRLRHEIMAQELGIAPGGKRPWYVRMFRFRKLKAERLLREWQYSMAEYETIAPEISMAPVPEEAPLPPAAMGLVREMQGKILGLEHRIAILENLVVEKSRRVPLFKDDEAASAR